MLYHWYEFGHTAVRPWRALARLNRLTLENPLNPFRDTHMARQAAAACEVFERITRRYGKPEFEISTTWIDGKPAEVTEDVVWRRPFCRLVTFRCDLPLAAGATRPNLLIVAPMSGHFAALLRGTVEALLPSFNVTITDWSDARDVPLLAGQFDLDDHIDYIIEMLEHFGGDVHVYAVCQPAVPVLAAVALLEAAGSPAVPRSMVLTGGPIDTRINPTMVNELAAQRGVSWFQNSVITTVPWPNSGCGRRVYPGFLQLSGFMTMNLDRHMQAHKDYFDHLVEGDGDSADRHRDFYDDYLAVMDLTEEFYLQTIDTVFVRHALPRGTMRHRGVAIEPSAIERTALMTIEGGNDDISGLGQCAAAHALCTGIPESNKEHFVCPDVGHYGLFNGSRYRAQIAPRLAQFVLSHDPREGKFQPVPEDSGRRSGSTSAILDPTSLAFTFRNK
ncbi:MAG: hypothetical protein RLZ98_962 [Pseudomonadota bacterium]|jgi:poly(3-hydroxybutyrate) depolymerase